MFQKSKEVVSSNASINFLIKKRRHYEVCVHVLNVMAKQCVGLRGGLKNYLFNNNLLLKLMRHLLMAQRNRD